MVDDRIRPSATAIPIYISPRERNPPLRPTQLKRPRLPRRRLNPDCEVVRGINPPGSPWRIADLKADIDVYGRIRVRGRGLLLAGGNGIGTNANQKVFATLICEAAGPFVEHSTDSAGVALGADGDFRIDDTLNPGVPTNCASPVLLIRNTGGTWFAAGIVDRRDDDN